jgi:hypothetical protein
VVIALAVAWLRRGGTVFNIGLELLAIGLASVLQAVLAVALTFGHARLPIGLVVSHALLAAAVNMVVGLLFYGPLRAILHPAPPEEVRGYAKA